MRPAHALIGLLAAGGLAAAGVAAWHSLGGEAPKSGAVEIPTPTPSPEPALPAGVDLAGLDPGQRKTFHLLLDQKPSVCGKSHSLRTSLVSDPSCRRSLFAARYIALLLQKGLPPTEAEEAYDKRFTHPDLGQCESARSPMRGNPDAPVTLCEFSDFLCPHCKLIEPVLARLLEEYRSQLKLYAKNFPLSRHSQAKEAAAAAVAAGRQNRFWPMRDWLFAHQESLTAADLEKAAGELQLNLKRWKSDLARAGDEVEADRAEGDKLHITGTPTLFINGRKYAGPLEYEMIKDWIEEELNR